MNFNNFLGSPKNEIYQTPQRLPRVFVASNSDQKTPTKTPTKNGENPNGAPLGSQLSVDQQQLMEKMAQEMSELMKRELPISPLSENSVFSPPIARYARKIFVGGLPVSTTIADLHANFYRFGPLIVDWPYKASYEVMPPNLMQLVSQCGPTDFNNFSFEYGGGQKAVISVKPWDLRNNECIPDPNWKAHERYSVFIGGVHRRATAGELAGILNDAIGSVVYVGMEIDEHTDYPKGAARVVFNNQVSYIKAIGTRRIAHAASGQDRAIELKPYVLPNMRCESCYGVTARFFCPEIRCLKYFCEVCWPAAHSQPGLTMHIPMDRNNLHLHTPKKYNSRMEKELAMLSIPMAASSSPVMSPWKSEPNFSGNNSGTYSASMTPTKNLFQF